MPDIIRRGSSPTVVVTISTVIDQSTLNPVSPTVSATVNGAAATITAWAWKVNGSTSGIAGPTTATPTYTPTTAGEKAITCDVTISGVVYASTPEYFIVGPTALSATIDAISDQSTLTPVVFDVDVTGGVTPYTYAWTVNGAVTDLDNATIEGPTYTPPAAQGRKAVACLITDAAGQTCQATPRSFVVGPTAFSLALTAVADSNDLATATLTATPTGGVTPITYAWTLVGPDETSQTTLIADATAASTTAVLASIASGQRAGLWTAQCVGTDAAGQAVTATAQWAVGRQVALGSGYAWELLVVNIDCTAAATDNYADADGAQTLGGLTWTSRNGVAGADTLGILNGTGLQFAPKADKVFNATIRTCPMIDIDILGALPTWTRRTPFSMQIVYTWTTPPAANISHLRLFASDTTPTTAAGGENILSCMDEYSGATVRSVSNTIRNGVGVGQNTAAGPSQGLELLYDGTGFSTGYSTADPGSTVVAPGTWTRHPTSATAGDTGRIPWSTRSSGTAPAADSAHRVGMAFSRDATGTAIAGHVRSIRLWVAA